MFPTLLILLFIRPFISSLAFPHANFLYSNLLLILMGVWIVMKGVQLEKIKALHLPIALFVLALFISLLFSHDKIISIRELYKYISGILLLLISMSFSYNENKRILLCIVASAAFVSVLAIYQYFIGFQHLLAYITKHKISNQFLLDYISQRRTFAPFVTPNTLGGYLAMIIPLALIYKQRYWIIALLLFALLLTKSLGALLSIFLALAIYFYLQGRLGKKGILFLCGLLIIFGLVFILRADIQKEYLRPIFSTTMRLRYWAGTLRIIQKYPLTGVGLGNFNLTESRYAHNSYLQICAEMGILGLISLLWLIFKSFKIGLKKIENSKNQDYIILGLLLASFAFLFHNLIDFTFFLPEVACIWWVILGLIAS